MRFADARGVFDAVTRELHVALARGVRAARARRPDALRPRASARTRARAAREPPPAERRRRRSAGSSRPAPDSRRASAEPRSAEPRSASTRPPRRSADGPPLFAERGLLRALRFVGAGRGDVPRVRGGRRPLRARPARGRRARHVRPPAPRVRRARDRAQRLLMPEVVELLPAEVAALEEHADDVARARPRAARGRAERRRGSRACPRSSRAPRPSALVRDIVAELGTRGERPFGDAADLVLATMACHG